MKAPEQREEELRHQIATMKAVTEKLRGGAVLTTCAQAFCGQPFSEEIDDTPILVNFRKVVVEPFDGTQDPHTHLQAFQTHIYINRGNDPLNCKLFP
ncbi:hypothetical protein CR513_06921, partial [Mucuna pruriens]